jgi:hypothetical protein
MSAVFALHAACAVPCREARTWARAAGRRHRTPAACSQTRASLVPTAALGGSAQGDAPSRRAFVGGALLGVASLCGATLEARASEAEAGVAGSARLISGDGWTLSAPADFAQEDLSPFLPPPGTTVGAGALRRVPDTSPVALTPRSPAAPQALPGFGPAPPPNPVKLKLLTPGGAEVVSLAVRRAADVRPQFLQVNDVADFGTLEEAASLFVPPRAKLLASSAVVHVAPPLSADTEPLPRTYFSYEFALGAATCYLVAAAKRGKVRCSSAPSERSAPAADARATGVRLASHQLVAGRCKGRAAARPGWHVPRGWVMSKFPSSRCGRSSHSFAPSQCVSSSHRRRRQRQCACG